VVTVWILAESSRLAQIVALVWAAVGVVVWLRQRGRPEAGSR
jgi:hypothetical protein